MSERDLGALASDVRTKLGGAWHSLAARAAVAPSRFEAIELDPLMVENSPLLAAVDSEGRRHLLVPLPSGSTEVEDSKSAGVNLFTRVLERDGTTQRLADLVCMRSDLAGVFSGLAADVCTSILGSSQPGLLMAQKLSAWRELFEAPPQGWSRSRLAGVFAEMQVLMSLLAVDSSAAATWSGPDGEAQDFRRGRHALEIKATLSSETRMVSVHGWDQLEAPTDGDLALGWIHLREADTGQTVAELIAACLSKSSTPADLRARLDRLGLDPLEPDALRLHFEVVDERWYEVDGGFPAITPARFAAGHVDGGVISVEYRIDLDTVGQDSRGRGAFVSRFLEAS